MYNLMIHPKNFATSGKGWPKCSTECVLRCCHGHLQQSDPRVIHVLWQAGEFWLLPTTLSCGVNFTTWSKQSWQYHDGMKLRARQTKLFCCFSVLQEIIHWWTYLCECITICSYHYHTLPFIVWAQPQRPPSGRLSVFLICPFFLCISPTTLI